MHIFRKMAVAAALVAGIGVPAGLMAASSASAAGPFVISATSLETSAHFVAPNVEALTFNLYQPSVLPPGFRLYATVGELCLVGVHGSVCNWRLTTNAPPLLQTELVGNAVIGPKGQAGNITGGTRAWRGARGIVRDINIAPNVASATYVFSTP